MPGTKDACKLGFYKKHFEGWLWKKDNAIYISMVISLNSGQGNLSRLFEKILKHGYTIKVPTPLGKMIPILKKKKFYPTQEPNKEYGEDVEVWVNPPNPPMRR